MSDVPSPKNGPSEENNTKCQTKIYTVVFHSHVFRNLDL